MRYHCIKELKYGLVKRNGKWHIRNYRRELKSGDGLDLYQAEWTLRGKRQKEGINPE